MLAKTYEKNNLVLTPELFVIPNKHQYIIYAPLKGIIASVNQATVKWLAGYPNSISESTKLIYHRFIELGLLEPLGTTKFPVTFDENQPFQPTDVILLSTTHCNFRCVYCYASAGTRNEKFKPEVARSAIRLVVKNAIAQSKTTVNLAFHGGGEPTTSLSFVKQCVAYAKDIAGGQVDIQPSIVTNGYLTEQQIDWLAHNMNSIQVSLDGPDFIQNEQRPLVNGKETFNRVCNTIHKFEQASVPNLLIKATISNKHVSDMPVIAEFFCKTFKTHRFHFGPLMEAGRSIETGYHEPDALEFVNYAEQAQQVAQLYNREIVVSLAQNTFPKIRLAFCGFTDPNFAVTVEGRVTGCYEVLYADDPRSNHTHFGQYLEEKDSFIFDENIINEMRSRIVPTLSRCKNCFAKWQCGGDCHMRLFDQVTGEEIIRPQDFRCQVNRELVRRKIIRSINDNDDTTTVSPSIATERAIV
jgi:uncharacterized protein